MNQISETQDKKITDELAEYISAILDILNQNSPRDGPDDSD